jgi:hypothetical protein
MRLQTSQRVVRDGWTRCRGDKNPIGTDQSERIDSGGGNQLDYSESQPRSRRRLLSSIQGKLGVRHCRISRYRQIVDSFVRIAAGTAV